MSNNPAENLSAIFKLLSSTDKNQKQKAASDMMSALSPDENKQLGSIMNDSDKINAILNSEAAQQIIRKLRSNQNGQHQ